MQIAQKTLLFQTHNARTLTALNSQNNKCALITARGQNLNLLHRLLTVSSSTEKCKSWEAARVISLPQFINSLDFVLIFVADN
jgi:hypothetical protein